MAWGGATKRRGLVPLLAPSVLGLTSVRRGLALHLPFMMGYGAFMFAFALLLQQSLHAGGPPDSRAGHHADGSPVPQRLAVHAPAGQPARRTERHTLGAVTLAVGLALSTVVKYQESTWT